VVGQQVAAALAGQVTVEEALATAQRSAEQTMKKAGYPK
jgi:sorbitol/mannitol transport system substrate-binding protein